MDTLMSDMVSQSSPKNWMFCVSLGCLGETVLPQTQCSVGPAGSVRRHPQAVELRWAHQSPGAAEAPQPALPHQGSTQRTRVQVTWMQITGHPATDTLWNIITINHANIFFYISLLIQWEFELNNSLNQIMHNAKQGQTPAHQSIGRDKLLQWDVAVSFSSCANGKCGSCVTGRSGPGCRVMFTAQQTAAASRWRTRAPWRAADWPTSSGPWERRSRISWRSSTSPSTGWRDVAASPPFAGTFGVGERS